MKKTYEIINRERERSRDKEKVEDVKQKEDDLEEQEDQCLSDCEECQELLKHINLSEHPKLQKLLDKYEKVNKQEWRRMIKFMSNDNLTIQDSLSSLEKGAPFPPL